jgi:predicted component of type VI protein secretion system
VTAVGQLFVTFQDLESGASWEKAFTKSPIVIGRDPSGADLVIAHASISKLQGELTFDDRDVWYIDHDSRNGSFIDGRAIPPETRVVVRGESALVLGKTHKITVSRDHVAGFPGPDAGSDRANGAGAPLPPTAAISGIPQIMAGLKAAKQPPDRPLDAPDRNGGFALPTSALPIVSVAVPPSPAIVDPGYFNPSAAARMGDAQEVVAYQAGGTKLLVPEISIRPSVLTPPIVGETKVIPEPAPLRKNAAPTPPRKSSMQHEETPRPRSAITELVQFHSLSPQTRLIAVGCILLAVVVAFGCWLFS